MALDPTERRSRRALLASAVGGAAALAATQLAKPLTVAAADPNDVLLNDNNSATAITTITQGTPDTGAFKAIGAGTGTGLEGASTTGTGVLGTTASVDIAGVVGTAGDTTGSYLAGGFDLNTGVYGFANADDFSSGLYGESVAGWGVYGYGTVGVGGEGSLGGYFAGSFAGLAAIGDVGATGAHAHAGGGTVPTPPANTALFASVGSTSQVGLEARGRVRFPNRSGRATIAKGKSSIAVSVGGVTSSNFAIATLGSNRSGRYVRAVVCSTGKITIYLNTTVTSATYVSWLVLG